MPRPTARASSRRSAVRAPRRRSAASSRGHQDESARTFAVSRRSFPLLIERLRARGYRVIGPRLGDGAVVYEDLNSADDLPHGWTDEQDGGTYRLRRRDDDALFGYSSPQHSWKNWLHPARVRLVHGARENGGFRMHQDEHTDPRFALVGVRSCDLHAIAIQDTVFLEGPQVDATYRSRREGAFIVAVNCTHAGGTCFCRSMETGPRAMSGFDLALTELLDERSHVFLFEVGSERGAAVLNEIPHRPATPEQLRCARSLLDRAARRQGRRLDTNGIRELLYDNYEHPRWQDVASRCLTCTNCTMVCPTCFCTTIDETSDLFGTRAERWRKWDSCYTLDFTALGGGSVRASALSRYRHWLTHKLATWIDQFGTSGCVGCGRCITWCPVAIDITEEVAAIRAHPTGTRAAIATHATGTRTAIAARRSPRRRTAGGPPLKGGA